MYITPQIVELAKDMLEKQQDWSPAADKLLSTDNSLCLCSYPDGAWVAVTHGEADMRKWTRLECVIATPPNEMTQARAYQKIRLMERYGSRRAKVEVRRSLASRVSPVEVLASVREKRAHRRRAKLIESLEQVLSGRMYFLQARHDGPRLVHSVPRPARAASR